MNAPPRPPTPASTQTTLHEGTAPPPKPENASAGGSLDRPGIIDHAMFGWYGVDLDGVLAQHYWSHPHGEQYHHARIGEPIAPMVERVKRWLSWKREVRIFTARVAPATATAKMVDESRRAIESWCERHIGQALRVTHEKDAAMVMLFDDRAVRMIQDTGEPCCDDLGPIFGRDAVDGVALVLAFKSHDENVARYRELAATILRTLGRIRGDVGPVNV